MQSMSRFITRFSPTLLRWSLAIVFVWFGVLNFINPMGAMFLLHSSVFFFLASTVFVYLLAALEIIAGLLLAMDKWVRYAGVLVLLILIGPLTILLTTPAMTGFPLALNTLGEFLLKDLVLASAALSIIAIDISRQL